jgi:hypothetical protein
VVSVANIWKRAPRAKPARAVGPGRAGAKTAVVLREGQETESAGWQVAWGIVGIARRGVCARRRRAESGAVSVDESALTGESLLRISIPTIR